MINCSLLWSILLTISFWIFIWKLLWIWKNWRWIRKLIMRKAYIFFILCIGLIFIPVFLFLDSIWLENIIDFISFCIIKIFFYVILIKFICLVKFFNKAWTFVCWFCFLFICFLHKSSIQKRENLLTQGDDFFEYFMKKSNIFLIFSIVWLNKKVTYEIKNIKLPFNKKKIT